MGRKGKKRQQKKQQQLEQAALGAAPAPGAAEQDDEEGDEGDEEGGDAPAASAPPGPVAGSAPTDPAAPSTPPAPLPGAPAPLPVAATPTHETIGTPVLPVAPGVEGKTDAPKAPEPAPAPLPAAAADGWPSTLRVFLDEQLKLTSGYVYALIAAMVFCVYANSMKVPFLFDDAPVITRERLFHELSWHNAWRIVTEHGLRPIPNLINYLNYHIQGTPAYQYASGPWAGTYGPNWTYHLFNMFVHAVNGILLYVLLKTLLSGTAARTAQRATAARRAAAKSAAGAGGTVALSAASDEANPLAEYIALGATLFWLVHPIQTMAVTYITQRYTLLGAFGIFGTLLCYAKLRRRMEAGTAWRSQNALTSWFLLAGMPLFWLFGCASKENTAVVPLVIPFFEWLCFTRTAPPGDRNLLDDIFGENRGRWALSCIMLPLFVAGVIWRINKVGLEEAIPSSCPTFPDRMSYFRTEWVVMLKYLKLYALPTDLTVEQAFPPLNWGDPGPPSHTAAMLFALLGHALIASLAIIWYRTGRKFLTLCVIWYYMMHAIESSILPILDPMVEHRMYVPSAFIAAGLAYTVARAAASIWTYGPDWTREVARRFAGSFTAVEEATTGALAPYARSVLEKRHEIAIGFIGAWVALIVAFGIGTHVRNYAWGTPDDSMRIWRDTVEKRPDCARAYSSLGMEMLYNGKWIDAVEPIEAALYLGPYHVEGWNNIGKAYLEIGSQLPNHGLQADKKKSSLYPCPLLEWARDTLLQGIRVNEVAPSPSVPLCWNNLGLTYMKMAERVSKLNDEEELRLYKLASEALTEATHLDPGYDTAFINLGTSYVRRAEKTPRGPERRKLALEGARVIKSSAPGRDPNHQLFTIAALNIALADKFADAHAEAFLYLDEHYRKCIAENLTDSLLAAMPLYADEASAACDELILIPDAIAKGQQEIQGVQDAKVKAELEAALAEDKAELDLAKQLQKQGRMLQAAEIFAKEADLVKTQEPKAMVKYLRAAAKLTWYGGGNPQRAGQLFDAALAAAQGDERTQIENEKGLLLSRPQPRF